MSQHLPLYDARTPCDRAPHRGADRGEAARAAAAWPAPAPAHPRRRAVAGLSRAPERLPAAAAVRARRPQALRAVRLLAAADDGGPSRARIRAAADAFRDLDACRRPRSRGCDPARRRRHPARRRRPHHRRALRHHRAAPRARAGELPRISVLARLEARRLRDRGPSGCARRRRMERIAGLPAEHFLPLRLPRVAVGSRIAPRIRVAGRCIRVLRLPQGGEDHAGMLLSVDGHPAAGAAVRAVACRIPAWRRQTCAAGRRAAASIPRASYSPRTSPWSAILRGSGSAT